MAGLLVASTHVPLGRRVLERGIVFIDLTIAQVAALAGVPLYLVYPASGAPPRILPQILTESLVVDALAAAAGESPSIPVQTRLQQPLEMDP